MRPKIQLTKDSLEMTKEASGKMFMEKWRTSSLILTWSCEQSSRMG